MPVNPPVRVFIVDDSAPLTEVMSELITDPGRVEIAGTADSAATAIEAIRTFPGSENIVVVLFTNHLSRALEKRAGEVGADFFFDKSRDHAKLIELIQEKARQRQG